MASPGSRALPTGDPSAGGDEFDDDIFDYDVGGENDPFSDNYKPPNTVNSIKDNPKDSAGLGIDEEVEVVRKPRAPRVKLDENRLLSDAGIPKLRKNARKHLKFKGKGHEYSDAARLLAFYQLWLDDLFPKARFLDALAMVEKMGHKKRMQSMRMEWINEGKPRSSVHDDSLFDEPEPKPTENREREQMVSRIAPIFEKSTAEKVRTPEIDEDADMDELYNATPRAVRREPGASLFGPATGAVEGPPDEDLDALLAEQEALDTTTQSRSAKKAVPQDDFEDDLDALMAEDEMMQINTLKPATTNQVPVQDIDIDEDMEAMAAEMGADMW